MLAEFRQALMSPVAGPIATATAFGLAVVLGVAANGWEGQRAAYEARIAQLSEAAQRSQADLRTELASCHAAANARPVEVAEFPGAAAPSSGARKLLERQPEGIDACARMESADRAVLSNLSK